MKIAYVASFANAFFNGVFRKIESQLSAWEKIPDIEIKLFFRAPQGVTVPGGKSYIINGMPTCSYNKDLFEDLREFAPDIVYLRHEIPGPQILQIAKAFARKIVLEVNSDIDAELELQGRTSLKRRIAFYVNKITQPYLEKYLAGCVCVSSNLLKKFPAISQDHKLLLPNTIDLAKHPIRKQQPASDERPALLFAGTPNQAWHGIDMLPKLAKALPECDFHIAGINAILDSPPNIYYYGYLQPEELSHLCSTCHIGIGTLALFRKQMSEACPLKVREYLAAGMPVILGYTDTAFLYEQPAWVHSIPMTETALDDTTTIQNIKNFIYKNFENIVTHEESSKYIDSNYFERQKIKILQSWILQ